MVVWGVEDIYTIYGFVPRMCVGIYMVGRFILYYIRCIPIIEVILLKCFQQKKSEK